MSEPCVICGAPHSCPHLMRRYDNPDVVVSPLIMESTPRKKPSKIEFLWFQCSQCGWGQRMSKAEAEVDEWEDGSACPHCGVGPIRSSPMGRFR